jgi:hypothetical protein
LSRFPRGLSAALTYAVDDASPTPRNPLISWQVHSLACNLLGTLLRHRALSLPAGVNS